MPGEFDFISWIRTQQPPSVRIPVPAGDDLAIMRWNPDDLLLVGVDQVADGIHFDSAIHPPRLIGRKVMNRNLSDCAAMACLPAAAVATVCLPRGTDLEYAKELYLGLRDAADPFDCPIIGGDTASWPGRLLLTVTILGRSAGIQPITRNSARPGDAIYVTGPLGGSILGRHMGFLPRIREAREIAQTGQITAMIDLSDGLSRDLAHICQQSGVGAVIDADALPIHDDARTLAAQSGQLPIHHALHDGEDHELLFTATPAAAIPYPRIGQITQDTAILLRRDKTLTPIPPEAWQHAL